MISEIDINPSNHNIVHIYQQHHKWTRTLHSKKRVIIETLNKAKTHQARHRWTWLTGGLMQSIQAFLNSTNLTQNSLRLKETRKERHVNFLIKCSMQKYVIYIQLVQRPGSGYNQNEYNSAILLTGAKVSWKSKPSAYVKPFATRRALHCSTESSDQRFTLKTTCIPQRFC